MRRTCSFYRLVADLGRVADTSLATCHDFTSECGCVILVTLSLFIFFFSWSQLHSFRGWHRFQKEGGYRHCSALVPPQTMVVTSSSYTAVKDMKFRWCGVRPRTEFNVHSETVDTFNWAYATTLRVTNAHAQKATYLTASCGRPHVTNHNVRALRARYRKR